MSPFGHPPDYTGGGIANLMRTIAEACGAGNTTQPPLAPRFGLDARALARVQNVVLLVADGIGAATLATDGCGRLCRDSGQSLSSVFPSTTAAAIPTFMTALPPSQHALTGWHMWLAELQAVTAVLPLRPRAAAAFADDLAALPAKLFDHAPLYPSLQRPAWVLSPREIAGSPFNRFHCRGADILAYADLDGMLQMLAGLVAIPGRKYIYAYWPDYDSVAHHYGVASREARQTLLQFCQGVDRLLADIAGSDTRIIVTADHGFIDSPESRNIALDDHRELADMLALPLCGEQRVAWCYLKPGAAADFEACAAASLGDRAWVVPSPRLIADGWFGPGPAHAKLASRVGDYALVMNDNWTIKDWLPGEDRYRLRGHHGGISVDEMRVPLVVLRA